MNADERDRNLSPEEQRNRIRSFLYKHGSVIDNGYENRHPERNENRRATCPHISLPPSGDSLESEKNVIVRVYGDLRVGKKTLIHRLQHHSSHATEEYVHTMGMDDNEPAEPTTFLLNGKEVQLEMLLESQLESSPFSSNVSMFIVVYSTDCRDSFVRAQQLLSRIANTHPRQRRMLLVANKLDLKRNTVVSTFEAKCVAKIYKCSLVEVSALLGVNIEWLWMEMLKQIEHPGETSWVERVVNRGRELARSCEEMVLRAIAT